MLAVVSAIAMISFSFQSLMRELWYGVALHRLHRSPFDCFCSKGRIRAPSKAWLPGSPASSQRSLTGDLNRGIDGVFEILRVVGHGLVSVAAAHAKVAGAHLAQGEPEMSGDRFGFLERHGASMPCGCPLIGGCAS